MVALSDTIKLEDHARTERRQAPGAGSWKDIKDHLPGADKLGGGSEGSKPRAADEEPQKVRTL